MRRLRSAKITDTRDSESLIQEACECAALPQSEFVEAIRVTDGMWVLREHGF